MRHTLIVITRENSAVIRATVWSMASSASPSLSTYVRLIMHPRPWPKARLGTIAPRCCWPGLARPARAADSP